MRMNAVRGIADAGLRKVVEDYIVAIPERLEPVAGKHDAPMLAAVAAWLARDFSAIFSDQAAHKPANTQTQLMVLLPLFVAAFDVFLFVIDIAQHPKVIIQARQYGI